MRYTSLIFVVLVKNVLKETSHERKRNPQLQAYYGCGIKFKDEEKKESKEWQTSQVLIVKQ